MICKNCKNTIESETCPFCGTENKDLIDGINVIRKIAGWVKIIGLILFVGLIVVFNVLIWGFSKEIFSINNVYDFIKYILIILLVLFICLIIKNVSHHQVKKFSSYVFGILSLGIILLFCIFKFILPIEIKDFNKMDTVIVKDEEIPTLYQVTKKDDNFFSVLLKNIEDEGVKFSGITINYYNPINEDEKLMYEEFLLKNNYRVGDFAGDTSRSYYKNISSKNQFILIVVGKSNVSYSVAEGNFETAKNNYVNSKY